MEKRRTRKSPSSGIKTSTLRRPPNQYSDRQITNCPQGKRREGTRTKESAAHHNDDVSKKSYRGRGASVSHPKQEMRSFPPPTHKPSGQEYPTTHKAHYQNEKFDHLSRKEDKLKTNYPHYQEKRPRAQQTNFNLSMKPSLTYTKPPKVFDASSNEGRREIARDTLKILEKGKYKSKNNVQQNIKSDIDHCVSGTKTIRKDWVLNKDLKKHDHMCKFEVKPETTFQAARNLLSENSQQKVCVLNFASAVKPGGGFINGRSAQEESLARQSALYKSLKKGNEMYEYHQKNYNPLYSDYMIYSPDVPVFRDNQENLLDDPFRVSVISSAAVNKSEIDGGQSENIRIQATMENRIKKIIQLAAKKKNDSLVLGAYGCGVFKNDPNFVSNCFKKILVKEGYGKCFKKVVFAITGPRSENFKAFSKSFNSV